ncbi:hypothetical protein C8J56DRAFT_334458 [Mycena floridula]|nr:hypothetical protein C8J56DRAFT_334458 [Mycena floridula]
MDSQLALEPFPEIPTEIMFLIIEHLVKRYPSVAAKLLLLSRDTKPIVERAWYGSITLNSSEDTDRLASMIESGCRPASFYQSHVQSICLAYTLYFTKEAGNAICRILSACSAIHTLGIYHVDEDEMHHASVLDMFSTAVRPSRLSLELRLLGNLEKLSNYPFFSLLTHLELWSYGFFEFDLSSLQCLVHLTYLALMSSSFVDSSENIIQFVSGLTLGDSIQVCVISVYASPVGQLLDWTTSNPIDPRIVFALDDRYDLVFDRNTVIVRDFAERDIFVDQWGRRKIEGDPDMWEEAEGIIAARRPTIPE